MVLWLCFETSLCQHFCAVDDGRIVLSESVWMGGQGDFPIWLDQAQLLQWGFGRKSRQRSGEMGESSVEGLLEGDAIGRLLRLLQGLRIFQFNRILQWAVL